MTGGDVALRKALVNAGRQLYEKDLVASTEGNLSVRLPDGTVLITPSGRRKGKLNPDDLVIVDLEGNALSDNAEPSSERHVHLAIFRQREDVNAVIHAHPRFCTGWALTGNELPWQAHPEIVVVMGCIPTIPYETPSTRGLGETVARGMGTSNACLMANHGAVTVGDSLEAALQRMEALESFAHSSFVASLLGGPRKLGNDEVARLRPQGRGE